MARLVGINHVALEVADVGEALAWYGRFFSFDVRGRVGSRAAFIDMGDQFLALMAGRTQPPDAVRHVGLVVDDKEAVRRQLRQEGISVQESGPLDFTDPWGNHVQDSAGGNVLIKNKTKKPLQIKLPDAFVGLPVAAQFGGMGLEELGKTEQALDELRKKGLAREP